MRYLLKIKYVFYVSTACHVRIVLILTNMISLKVVHPLNISQYIEFHGQMLSGTSFAYSQNKKVRHFGVVEAKGLGVLVQRSSSIA
jgi:hypothetical protein